jgi:hypothetical protein
VQVRHLKYATMPRQAQLEMHALPWLKLNCSHCRAFLRLNPFVVENPLGMLA